jgi:DNA-binding MarR family transcriptional regulator
MDFINNIQAEILENLGRFAYLTVSQLQRITGKSLSYLREQLANLVRRKFIASYHIDRPGKAENMYYLTTNGKEILVHHEKFFADDIKLPKGIPLVLRDYNHRKHFIDAQIALYAYLHTNNIDIPVFLTYFDKQGNNRTDKNLEAKTKISLGEELFYIPDGIMITENSYQRKLYLIELYNGKDTLRVLQQLSKHVRAIALGTASKKFEIQDNPVVLCMFELESNKTAVIKRLETNERFTAMSELFFFASLETVQNNCGNAFVNVNKKQLNFKDFTNEKS